MTAAIVDSIVEIFRSRGGERYGVEEVSQLEHAIQTALLAQQNGAPSSQVAAALLHDVGHLLSESALPGTEDENYDDHHEARGYAWLLEHFGPAIADPVRLHVAAKRYLCTVEPSYANQLSPTSLKSFYDQGDFMSDQERAEFEREPFFEQAVQLRRWDDLAKSPDLQLPPVESFEGLLSACLQKSPKHI